MMLGPGFKVTPMPQWSLGGKHSNQCAIPAPHSIVFYAIFWAGLYNCMMNVLIFSACRAAQLQ